MNVLNTESDNLSTEIPQKLKRIPISPFCPNNKTLAAAPHVNKTFISTFQIENLLNSITFKRFTDETSNRLSDEYLGEISNYFHNDHLSDDKIGIYILNIYLAYFDWEIAWKSAFLGIDYTRYKDKLCLSTNDEDSSKLKLMINLTKNELKRLSLTITPLHPEILDSNSSRKVFNRIVDKKGSNGNLGEILKNLNPTKVTDNDIMVINNTELRSSRIIYNEYEKNLLVLRSMGESSNAERIRKVQKNLSILRKLYKS
ncbi:MAG: hypothetical protein QW478_11530 [Candidatus Micrarchaeaceae archaeon]